MELKEKLAELRSRRGLSQQDVAEALDVSRQAVSRWETGAAVPGRDSLLALSRLFGVSVEELVSPAELAVPPAEKPGKPEGGGEPPEPEAGSRRPGEGGRGRKAAIGIAAGALLLLVLLCVGVWLGGEEEDEDYIQIEDMMKRKVEPPQEDRFKLKLYGAEEEDYVPIEDMPVRKVEVIPGTGFDLLPF